VDIKPFSFAYHGLVRQLVANVVTPNSGESPYTTWSLLAAPFQPGSFWATLARDIILLSKDKNPVPVLTNPYGLIPVGDLLYMLDFASRKIYIIGKNELNGLPAGSTHVLENEPIDLDALFELPPDAKPQAFVLRKDADGKDHLFVLLIRCDDAAQNFDNSILLRLAYSDTSKTFVADGMLKNLKPNAQEITLILKGGVLRAVITTIGGRQKGGRTNGTNSAISWVPAFGEWTTSTPITEMLTGDPESSVESNTNCDFHRFTVSPHQENETETEDSRYVYIVAGDYNTDHYNGLVLQLYRTTVGQLFDAEYLSISEALEEDLIEEVDRRTLLAPDAEDPSSIYFLDTAVVRGDTQNEDLLAFFVGSALYITTANDYVPMPDSLFPDGTTRPAPREFAESYCYFPIGTERGQIGDLNVNYIDLTWETVLEVLAGAVAIEPQKRGIHPHTWLRQKLHKALSGTAVAKAAKAAIAKAAKTTGLRGTAIPGAAAAGEEEEDKR
jgi:hypothetical protein